MAKAVVKTGVYNRASVQPSYVIRLGYHSQPAHSSQQGHQGQRGYYSQLGYHSRLGYHSQGFDIASWAT